MSMRLLNSLFSDVFSDVLGEYQTSPITTTDDAYIITVDVPGIPKSALNVDLTNRSLTISGERKCRGQTSKLQREFIVPAGTSTDDINATCEDGVLTVKIAKQKQKQLPSTKIVVT